MKKTKFAFICLTSVILLFFTSCQKDDMDKGGTGGQNNHVTVEGSITPSNSSTDSIVYK